MTDSYRVPSASARVAQAALMLFALSSVAYAGITVVSIRIVNAVRAGTAPMLAPEQADSISAIVAGITLIFSLTAIIASAFWIYRSNKNAHLLSSEIKTGPVMALVWFIVPILNLSRPFVGVQETWRVSHNPSAPSSVRTPAMMFLWWFSWLMSLLIGNLAFQLSKMTDLDALYFAQWFDLVAVLFGITAALCFTQIIKRITEKQASATDTTVFE